MKSLNYLVGHTVSNSSIRIYVNKIESRITSKIKTGYYLKHSTPETTKLLGSTKSKTTKDKNGENVPHLEITEVVLIHCNIAMIINKIQEYRMHLFPIHRLVNY